MITLLLLAVGCGPKTIARPAPVPAPLEVRPFTLPAYEERVLSNGIRVLVAENHEVPEFEVRLLFRVGGFTDPEGKEGTASVTLDMMNEGAGSLSAEDISRELKRLASSIGTGADDDGAAISASGLVRNLEPTLALWGTIVREPTFPAGDWEILRTQRVQNLKANREDPAGIAGRVAPVLLYGDAYRGRLVTEESLGAIATTDMAAWRDAHLNPANALVLAGGDITADVIVPLLERELGAWKATGTADAPPEPKLVREAGKMFLVDKPGAAQSVVRVMSAATSRTDADHHAMIVANEAFGGAFTGRLNMNLREDKGYTYGIRCGSIHRYGPSTWSCNASVATDVTGPSIDEIRKEITAVLGDRPITADEVATFGGSIVYGFPTPFELTQTILDEEAAIWRYGLGADWTTSYVPKIRAVTAEQANAALREHVRADDLTWLVVGDAAKVRPAIEALGFTIVELDRDGRPLTGGN